MEHKNLCIMIYCDSALPLCARLIQFGIEEEGVPGLIEMMPVYNVLEAAKQGAEISRLMVGVAANRDKMVVQHQKLSGSHPILCYPSTQENARLVGKNAARLVKGLPFDLRGME